MSAAILRRAADRLDELAGAVPSPPWFVVEAGKGSTGEFVVDSEPQLIAGNIGIFGGTSEPVAAYIAAMHPGVGQGFAAWLRAEAGYLEACDDVGVPPGVGRDEALAVARQILGEQS